MLAHNLKHMLAIVPELKEHIKQANIEEEFPLDNKDGCLASYLRGYYLTKIAGKPIEEDTLKKIQKAAMLYNVTDEAKPFIASMKKYAEELQKQALAKKDDLTPEQAQINFEANLGWRADVGAMAKEAKSLYEKHGDKITSEEVLRYSGNGYFNKVAAIESLLARTKATNRTVFEKMASVIETTMNDDASPQEIRDVCDRITELDHQSGLEMKGFNIYKEAVMTNKKKIRSALIVKLAGKQVPYEKIAQLGNDRIGMILGKEVRAELSSDPVMNKRILESLPMDMHKVLLGVIR